ncbi:MAG: SDR family oxidoreductase [Bdellovibrionales bacterium]|nr:SDR family oxidoreductase [Bdellovibrionales bacterium]
MSLKNNVVIVTGGATGIGRAISLRLAKDGYHVLIHYNSSADAAKSLVTEITGNGGSATSLSFNVKDRKDGEDKLSAFFTENPTLTLFGLVNNAGITKDTLVGLMSDEDFTDVIETNVYGAFFLMRWAVKKMLIKKSGSIVNMSSISGQTGNAGQFNYAASKAAVIAMTKSLSQEVGRKGVRVNAVAPGVIETKMIEEVAFLEGLKQRIPMQRFGKAEEVASVVSFLMSGDASYVTGQTISVNGGLYSP